MDSNRFPRLSSPYTEIEDVYDVVVVGSGYGGSIAASRCARAGQKVCLLERGKEWLPGEFPEGLMDARNHVQITKEGKKGIVGDPTDLYEFIINKDITVLQGCGLGGGSLINANVGLDVDERVFDLPRWPKELKEDMANLKTTDKQHVMEMLRPTPYPDSYPPLPKMEAMKSAAKKIAADLHDVEDLDDIFIKTPLYVNFDGSKPNPVGIHQPACNGCGNCCGGCNTGAKNTLNMNYIPDAVAHGASVFTQIIVSAIVRDSPSSLWSVYYSRKIPDGGFYLNEHIVRAKFVILGAGALGSTKLLLKSKERGLQLSDSVGHHFSGNGDVIGFCCDANKKLNAVGKDTGMYDKVQTDSPGPTITAALDLRKMKGRNVEQGMILEDGTCPSIAEIPYSVSMAVAKKLIGTRNSSGAKIWQQLYEKISGNSMDKTMAFLTMSHDDAEGKISLDKKTNQVHVSWDGVGRQKNFEKVNQQIEKVAHGMGGTFVKNPAWTDSFGKELVTAHPIGGCCMGENGKEGVVNHKGQVFIDDSSEVYTDLYVMDGAILPTAVGVNPTMTISILAERCCRLMAKDAGWTVDYAQSNCLDPKTYKKRKPGMRFTERMVGTVDLHIDDKPDSKGVPCEFTVTIESQDLEKMLNTDPDHSADITGTVTCPGLSPDPLQILNGAEFQLFKDSKEVVDAKEMVYSMPLLSVTGEKFQFEGIKIIKKDKFGELGLEDTTTLFVKIYESDEQERKQIGEGILKIKFFDFMKQLQTMEVLNVKSEVEQIKWKTKFSNFFAKALWDTYSGFAPLSLVNPSSPPRKLRPLNIGSVVPEVFMITTEDKIDLKLVRYRGGTKGPMVVVPGLTLKASAFAIDTVPENFVEYMVRHHFDVWLFDWRGSPALPWACYGHYTIDDVAQHDFPAAVDKVLQVTGEKDVQIVAQCVGSINLFASLLSGRLDGKVRSVIACQVSATPLASTYNNVKAVLRVPDLLRNVGQEDVVDTYTDANATIKNKLFNWFCRMITGVVTERHEKCNSPVCHRLTAAFGLLFEHENLNVDTHVALCEVFGVGNTTYFSHLSRMFRNKKLVSSTGKDIYLPKMEMKNRLECPEYMKHIGYLNIPIMFFFGDRNKSFCVDANATTHGLVVEAHPSQHYEHLVVPGYGHIDGFLGKDASKDIYPKFLPFLEKYANDSLVTNTDLLTQVQLLMDMKKMKLRKKVEDNSDKELVKRWRDNMLKSVQTKTDDTEIPSELRDAPFSKLQEIAFNLDTILPNEKIQVWKRKNRRTMSWFRKKRNYIPPTGNHVEKVMFEEIFLSDDALKREIFVLSDLHLGGEWSHNIGEKLKDFSTTLAKIAEYCCHSIILLGDIFDMWQTPITTSPPNNKEYVKKWKQNEDINMFTAAIRKMAEDDNVNVFYVRGNHDHEITAEEVKLMFGSKVRFVPGMLIYIIDNGVSKHRIRFEHGHDYDLFNSYSILPESFLAKGLPLGYYITRSTSSSEEKYMNETEKVIEDVLNFLLSNIPTSLLGSTIMEMLAFPSLSKRIHESLLEKALDRDITGGDAVVMSHDYGNIQFKELIHYPFIRDVVKKFGGSRTYGMLKASIGDWGDFLREFDEDVVVLAHSHYWKNEVRRGKHGDMNYVNSGTLIDFATEFSYVKLSPPKQDADGFIEVNYKANDLPK